MGSASGCNSDRLSMLMPQLLSCGNSAGDQGVEEC
jgi:hypothetical protein